MDERDDVDEPDDPVVTADDIEAMAAEIDRGLSPGQSAVVRSPAHLAVWDDLSGQRLRRRWLARRRARRNRTLVVRDDTDRGPDDPA